MNYLARPMGLILAGVFFVCASASADDRFEQARSAANRGRFSEARTIWEELSEAGNLDATYSLGRMYARGDGVRKDFGRARDYFEEAAKAGHMEATGRLGAMYYYGDGVKPNRTLAFAHLRRAADGGSEYARDLCKKLGVPESVSEAYTAAPTPGDMPPGEPIPPPLPQADSVAVASPTPAQEPENLPTAEETPVPMVPPEVVPAPVESFPEAPAAESPTPEALADAPMPEFPPEPASDELSQQAPDAGMPPPESIIQDVGQAARKFTQFFGGSAQPSQK